jgi:heterodisulfide reductase subunit C
MAEEGQVKAEKKADGADEKEVPVQEFVVVDCDELDPGFRDEVAREAGGENIRRCFQCGTCVAMCPVAEHDSRYDPRRIIRMVNMGMRKQVLSGPGIWLCSGCYNCFERCPQDVKPTQILQAIQHIASREGYTHKAFKGAIGLLVQRGRLIEVSEFDNRARGKLGLPEIKEDAEPTKKIVLHEKIDKRAADSGQRAAETKPDEGSKAEGQQGSKGTDGTKEPGPAHGSRLTAAGDSKEGSK